MEFVERSTSHSCIETTGSISQEIVPVSSQQVRHGSPCLIPGVQLQRPCLSQDEPAVAAKDHSGSMLEHSTHKESSGPTPIFQGLRVPDQSRCAISKGPLEALSNFELDVSFLLKARY